MSLMALQQQQLDDLADWLSIMEDKIKVHRKLGSDLDQVKQQVEEHKKLQEELDQQQKRVDSLQNMVVVVDDSNTESGKQLLSSLNIHFVKEIHTHCHSLCLNALLVLVGIKIPYTLQLVITRSSGSMGKNPRYNMRPLFIVNTPSSPGFHLRKQMPHHLVWDISQYI